MNIRWAVAVAGIAVAAVLVPIVGSSYVITLCMFACMYVALASGWDIISGYTGYVSFGHVVFFGIGSYTTALAVTVGGLPIGVALILSAIVPAVVALLLGLVCLRLQGPYFAICTLGFNELVRVIILNSEWTGGGSGVAILIPREMSHTYWAMLIGAALSVGLSFLVARSRFGLRLLAIREDELAAESGGINTARHKILAFMISAILPGYVGGVYAWNIGYIEPTSTFSVVISTQVIIMALFGGRATVAGPVIGAVVLFGVQEAIWARFPFVHLAIFGALLIVVVMFMPRGIMGLLRQRNIYSPQRLGKLAAKPVASAP